MANTPMSVRRLLLTTSIAAVCATAAAQIADVPTWRSVELDRSVDFDWGDYDGDGDLDLAVANCCGEPNRIYVNDGAGDLTLAWSTTETDDSTSVAWGDLDRDGDLDLAIGNRAEPNRLYLNDGTGILTLAWSSTEIDASEDVAWGDWDADDDLDLAVANSGGEPNRLYRSRGGTLDLQWSSAELDDSRALAWGDLDGDGDADLAFANFGEANRAYRNDGFGMLTLVWSSTETEASTDVAWGDADGDGSLDLAVSNDGTEDRVYGNSGGVLASIWTSTEREPSLAVAWGDLDGDGLADLAIGTGDGAPWRTYRNDGGTFTPWQRSVDPIWTPDIACADLDGDGDLEVSAAVSAAAGAANLLFRNDNCDDGACALAITWMSTETDDTQALAWADADGDGDLDLATGNLGQPNRLYDNDAGRLSLIWSATEIDQTTALAWGDWNGDGDLDLAVGNQGEVNRVYENDGAGNLSLAWSSTETDSTRAVAWGDWDDDGDLDLAVGNAGTGEANRVYQNDGGTFTLRWTSTELDDTQDIAWADWDGDGDLDLATANVGVFGGHADRLYRNEGGFFALVWSSATFGSPSLAWGDADGDALPDLAVGGGFEPDRIYRNTCGGEFEEAWRSSTATETAALAWADWDGDGDLDLAAAKPGDGDVVYRNDGGWTFIEIRYDLSARESRAVAWGDVDGDGLPELAVGALSDETIVFDTPFPRSTPRLADSPTVPVFARRPGGPMSTPIAAGFSTPDVQPASSVVIIEYLLVDADSDIAPLVRAEYSTNGGAAWRPATRGIGGDPVSALQASPSGELHTFHWDARGDEAYGPDVRFRLAVVYQAPDGKGGPIQHPELTATSASFRVERERFPALSITKTADPSGGVMPGETITWSIRIENTGLMQAAPVTVTDVVDDPNLINVRNLLCPAFGVGTIDTSGPFPVVTCAGMVIGSDGRSATVTFEADVADPFSAPPTGPEVCNAASMSYECNATPSDPAPATCVSVDAPAGCSATSLPAVARLMAVKEGATGVRLSWDRAAAATEYHVNAVVAKADLEPPGPYRRNRGIADPICEAFDPVTDCLDSAPPVTGIRHYQVLGACGPLDIDEGAI